jgi:cell division protein FtsB
MGNKRKISLGKIIFVGVTILLSFFLIYDIFLGKLGVREYFHARGKYHSLQEKKGRIEEEKLIMEEEAASLEDNLSYIEEIARKELGMVKEKETIIILKDEENNHDKEANPLGR